MSRAIIAVCVFVLVFVLLRIGSAVAEPPSSPGGPLKCETDHSGQRICWYYIFSGNPRVGTGWYPIPTKPVDVQSPNRQTHKAGIIVYTQIPPDQPLGPPAANAAEAGSQVDTMRGKNKDAAVLHVEGYKFGSAGSSAVGTAFVYGVVTQLTSDPGQSTRIAALQAEIGELNAALKKQSLQHAASAKMLSEQLLSHAGSIEIALHAMSDLPTIKAVEPLLAVADGVHVFATQDPLFALRLKIIADQIEQVKYEIPGEIRDIGLAAVRFADVEHAAGNVETANNWADVGQSVVDFAVGLDPVTGTIRGAYELVTGINVVTGEPLNEFERGIAFLNFASMGGFGTVERAIGATVAMGRILGGMKFATIKKALASFKRFFPSEICDKLLKSLKSGAYLTEEGTYLTQKGKSLVPVYPSDGIYARVMPRSAANSLKNGGVLSTGADAFVTAAEDLPNLLTHQEVQKRLSLFKDAAAHIPHDLNDHVLVRFKLKVPESTAITSRFGRPNEYGYGHMPGGKTIGGAREYIVDSDAIQKGLIDHTWISIENLMR